MSYGDSHSYEESAKERMERGTRMMEAKANLLRTLVVLVVGLLVAVAVALFGAGLRTAEPQTTATIYYKVQDLGTVPGATYSLPTSVPYGINDSGHVVGDGDHKYFQVRIVECQLYVSSNWKPRKTLI